MSYYEILLKPLLFKMDPEKAHEMSRKILRFMLPFPKYESERLRVKIKDIETRNPLGLAAGFDKNAEMLSFLSSLGFGYVTLGSVLLNENKGNPKPRIVRYPRKLSMTNAMGLPSVGLRNFLKNLSRQRSFVPFSISIAGNNVEEITKLYSEVSKWSRIVEINLKYPKENPLQNRENFEKLSNEISKIKRGIIFVKISPFKTSDELIDFVNICMKKGIDGITAINTLNVKDKNLKIGEGGLSGRLIHSLMLKYVRIIHRETKGKLIINACGGIFNGREAFNAIIKGATTFQIYTSFVYEGFPIIRKILKELDEILKAKKFSNIEEAIGYNSLS